MNRIVGLFVVLAILSAFFWAIESLFAAKPEQRRTHKRRGFVTDLVYWFATPLLTRSVSQVGIGVILILIYRTDVAGIQAMLANRATYLASLPLFVQVPAMLLVGDFIGYWLHRAFHRGRLWRFHAVHHSSQDLDWLSSVRLHPVNGWITRWVQATVLIVLGFAPLAVAAYVPFLAFYAIVLHANVGWSFGPFARILASPKFHRWHHTAEDEGLDKNFSGLFPVWDQLFGTYFMPQGRLPDRFGLSKESLPDSYLGQLVYPFRKPRASAEATVPGPN